MNLTEAYAHIASSKPKVAHLTGKTSTGKSRFSGRLHDDFGFEVIELDYIVRDAVVRRFGLTDVSQAVTEVYKNRRHADWIDSFIAATRGAVDTALARGHPAVIDGAISNPQTLKQLYAELPPVTIVFLHPADIGNYARNLTNRLLAARDMDDARLPDRFWSLIDKDEYARFLTTRVITSSLERSIRQYAEGAPPDSLERLDALREHFEDVLVVDI